MKILEPLGWGGLTVRCQKCQTKLLVEATDMRYSLSENCFCADCAVCGERIPIDKEDVPASVQTATLLQMNETSNKLS